MKLKFIKMHSLGNDFMVIDGISEHITLTANDVVKLANRHTGIGFDQCLIAMPSKEKEVDFYYKIFNADGSVVGQCGNGARCIARFLYDAGVTQKTQLTLATFTTKFNVILHENDVSAIFAPPLFAPKEIPINFAAEQKKYSITIEKDKTIDGSALNVGNPHFVICVENVALVDVQTLGKTISEHTLFPERTNVEFMQCIDKTNIKLRVYERGCGETLACGSGAVAAAIVARKFYHLDAVINVHLPGGILEVRCELPESKVALTGQVAFIYKGELY